MEKYAIPNKLPSKQVAILAHRRKRINQDKARITQKHTGGLKKFKGKGFIKPETLVASYRKAERDDMRIKRTAEVYGLRPKTFVKDESRKLILVFRHRGNRIAAKSVIHILREMRLSKKYHATLMKVTDENLKLLAAVEPYVSWGYPSIQTVRDLVFKYGFTKEKGKKVNISSNLQVEQALGDHNIICMEDLVHELFTVGPHFDEVNNFLTHFVLQAPKTGWEKSKGQHFSKGGESGFRGENINELFASIL
uniref:CSON000769 protein n=1 Tax=Culicoides sonorensis TaxID=179676 RepID=A0A336MF87_CULSO